MRKQRTVLVTGAAGGLGQAIVKEFIKQGDFVYIADFNEAAARETASLLGENC